MVHYQFVRIIPPDFGFYGSILNNLDVILVDEHTKKHADTVNPHQLLNTPEKRSDFCINDGATLSPLTVVPRADANTRV